MTIELGFAWITLPDGSEIGVWMFPGIVILLKICSQELGELMRCCLWLLLMKV